ncbi:hypothetical protein LEMLEM_LOCUS11432 [Lemmus lemmus]
METLTETISGHSAESTDVAIPAPMGTFPSQFLHQWLGEHGGRRLERVKEPEEGHLL